MDWLQFTSSVISAVAWPSVVAYLLFLLRRQVTSLAQRLTELSLPGGTKALFRNDLESAQQQAELIKAQSTRDQETPSDSSESAKSLVPNSPGERVTASFARLLNFIEDHIATIPIINRRGAVQYISDLAKAKTISMEVFHLFFNLADASQDVHRTGGRSVSNDDAIEFERLCIFFREQLVLALADNGKTTAQEAL